MSTFFDKFNNSKAESDPVSVAAANTGRTSARVETAQNEPYEIKKTSASPVPHQREEPVEEHQQEEEGELTVDIYNKGDMIVIQSTVAGVKPEHLDVAITDDMVTIRGRRERHENVAEDKYYYKELFWGAFSRQVILPEEIDQEEAEAHLQHGLLTIKLPKKKHGITQKLKVKVV